MAPDGAIWRQMAPDLAGDLRHLAPDGGRYRQILPSGAIWRQMAPFWRQMALLLYDPFALFLTADNTRSLIFTKN